MRTWFTAWLYAARLRTLPLSFSGILLGSAVAIILDEFSFTIFSLAIWVTICLQVLSNFANDLGDGTKGTDNDNRIGPLRALQSGMLSRESLRNGIVALSVLCAISVFLLLWIASLPVLVWVLLGLLGIAALWASLAYTLGNRPYGYQGFGDLMVFLFFGIVSVIGSISLFTKSFEWEALGFAICAGSLSTMVLNLNNLRDHQNDRISGKTTLVVRFGLAWAKSYHLVLGLLAFAGFLFSVFFYFKLWVLITALFFVVLLPHFRRVFSVSDYASLDPELKKIALFSFSLALLVFLLSFIR